MMERLGGMLKEIEALAYEEYEGIERAPTAENIERAISFLKSAWGSFAYPFPSGYASTTGGGDIRIYWTAPESALDLIFPESLSTAPMLYEAWSDRESCLLNDASPGHLALRLADFNGRREAEIKKRSPATR